MMSGLRLPRKPRDHAMLALQGTFLYGVSYVCVYYAERHVASGLVAVGYSASPLITGLGASALFGIQIGRRFVVGGLLGLAGVALIFWPGFGRADAGRLRRARRRLHDRLGIPVGGRRARGKPKPGARSCPGLHS